MFKEQGRGEIRKVLFQDSGELHHHDRIDTELIEWVCGSNFVLRNFNHFGERSGKIPKRDITQPRCSFRIRC